MKKVFIRGAIVAAFAAIAGYGVYANQERTKMMSKEMSEVLLENAEALASGESLGCGRAAYEYDNDWYEDTKHFTKCQSGCPDAEGTSPKYIDC